MRPLAFADYLCIELRRVPAVIAWALMCMASVSVQLSAQETAPATDTATQSEDAKPEGKSESEPAKEAASEPATDAEPGAYAGQDDLNQAIDAKLDADSLDAMQKVIDLSKSALAKGISEQDTEFAKEMIGATLLQKAQKLKVQLQESRLGGQQGRLRVIGEMEKALKSAVEYSPKLVEAYALLSALHFAMERLDDAREDMNQAIKIAEETRVKPDKLSGLYLDRAILQSDPAAKLADVSKAAEIDPFNGNAWQAKVLLQQKIGDNEAAVQTVLEFLKVQTDNLNAIELAVDKLIELERPDEALRVLNEKIPELQVPISAALLRVRGKAKFELARKKLGSKEFDKDASEKEFNDVIADCTAALELAPQDIEAYFLRSEAYFANKKYEEASRDVEKVIVMKPDAIQALLLRVNIASAQGRVEEAVADFERLVRNNPKIPEFLIQLAQLYIAADRPRLAIETCNEAMKVESKYWATYRVRGDAYLSVGEQEKAIEDFEKCLELIPAEAAEQRSGVLNNLSWVLATSPKDGVRNGARALELATEACEITEYKQAHVLSTLAAAYAETGDFEKAREWSTKAVDAGKAEGSEQLEQLELELKSYQENKPWRELQETTESAKPSVQIEKGVDA